MKLSLQSLSKYTFWLSFFTGIPNYYGLVPIQSFNISLLPALILLIKSNKVLLRDCFLALLFLAFYVLVWILSSDFSGYITLFEFSSVILIYIALRSFQYFPSQKEIIIYLIASVAIGLLQLSQSGIDGYRGIALLSSEPSRYARFLSVLILPIFIYWNSLRSKLGLPTLVLIFSFLLFCNRSASLIVPIMVIAFTAILFSLYYLKRFLNTFKINKNLLFFYSSISIIFSLIINYLSSNFNIRIINFLTKFINLLFENGQFFSFLRTFGSRRLTTMLYSFQSGIKSIIPSGVDSAKNILTYENLNNSFFGLNNYQIKQIAKKEYFESASFFSHLTLDCGLIAFLLSILFTLTILNYLKKSYFNLLFEEDISNNIRIELALRISTSFMGLLLLWFYSTNAFIAPWLMISIGLQPIYKRRNY